MVIHNPGYKETKFQTPNGNVTLVTTSDQEQLQTGKTLVGTVMVEPKGKNEKEKNRNLDKLKKILLTVGGTAIAITGLNQKINYSAAGNSSPGNFNVSLADPSGNTGNVSWRTPTTPVNTYPGTSQMPMTINENLVLGDNIITLNAPPHANSMFTGADAFMVTDSRNMPIPVTPIAQSPSTTIIQLPENTAPGPVTVSRTRNNTPVDNVTFNNHDLVLSSADNRLNRGQVSSIRAEVTHAPNAVTPYPINLQFRNTTPGIVSMQGGDILAVTLQGDQWSTTRQVTGLGSGTFAVNVTLMNDDNSTNDPFTTQAEAINIPADFNNWTSALQQDLQHYRDAQSNSPVGQNVRSNANRAIEQIPKCDQGNSLAECKSLVRQLLQPLNITKAVAAGWLSTAVAKKLSPNKQDDKMSATVAGFLDPFSKTLWVVAAERSRILASLGATQVNDGYRIQSNTITGKLISYIINVVNADKAAIAGKSQYIVREWDPNSLYDPGSYPGPIPDPAPPVVNKPINITIAEEDKKPKFVTQFTDSTGTAYRFYTDAECKKTWDGTAKGDCKADGEFVADPVTKENVWKENGKYRQYEWYPSYYCVYGTGYCVTTLQVLGLHYIYSDKNCTKLVNVKPIISWSCK